jgi:hypothetical protein
VSKFQIGDQVVIKHEALKEWEEFRYKTCTVLRVTDREDFIWDYIVYIPDTFRASGEFGFFEEELDFAPQTN